MPKMVVKVQRPLTPLNGADTWLVCDQARSLNRFMRPDELPSHVRRALEVETLAYFYAMAGETNAVVFGQRFIGDPGWI